MPLVDEEVVTKLKLLWGLGVGRRRGRGRGG